MFSIDKISSLKFSVNFSKIEIILDVVHISIIILGLILEK